MAGGKGAAIGEAVQGITTMGTGIFGAIFGWKSAKVMAAAQICVASEQAGAMRYQAYMGYCGEKVRAGVQEHQTDSNERVSMAGMELQKEELQQTRAFNLALNRLASAGFRPMETVIIHERSYDEGKDDGKRYHS